MFGQLRKGPRRPKKISQTARIAQITGGGAQATLVQIEDLNADRVLASDVAEELEPFESLHADLALFPLADGHTSETLASKRCVPGSEKVREKGSNIDLSLGLGQFRPLAHFAALDLIEDPKFAGRLNAEIITPAQQMHDGNVRAYQIDTINTICGATGSGGALPITDAVVGHIATHTSCPITSRFVLVGSFSYSGLGERIHLNGSAAVAEVVDYVVNRERSPWVIRTAEFYELPILGDNKRAREEFLRQSIRAIQCSAVQKISRQRFPNECLDSQYGCIRTLQLHYYNPLGSYALAAQVARELAGHAGRLLQIAADPDIGSDLKVIVAEEQLNPPSPETLIEVIKRSKNKPLDLESLFDAPTKRFSPESVQIGIVGDEPRSLSSVMTSSSRSFEDLERKLALLMGIQFCLDRHIKDKVRTAQRASANYVAIKAELASHLAWIFPGNWWQHCAAMIADRAKNIKGAFSLIQKLRHHREVLDRVTAEAKALGDASVKVAAEICHEQERARQIHSLLLSVADSASPEAFVDVEDTSRISARLMDHISTEGASISEKLIETLAQGVKCLRLESLASIFGISEVRPELIAQAIARSQPVTIGPPWGGRPSAGKLTRFMVIPALRDSDFELVQPLVAQIDPNLILVCSDSAKGSCNAVLLEIQCAQSIGDILTPFHIQHLRKACETPELFFSAGFDGPRWLSENIDVGQEGSTQCDA